jgi:hypothetical protein
LATPSIRYAETEMSFEVFKDALTANTAAGIQSKLYGPQGITLEQVRVAGLGYEDDGSVDLIPPCPPYEIYAEMLGSTAIRLRWAEAEDDCPVDDHEPCPPTGVSAEAIGSGTVRLTWEESLDDGDCSGSGGGPIDNPDDYLLML